MIEITVVVAVIGLLLLMGAVRMDVLTPDRALVSGARILRATLEEMRAAVLLRGEPAALVYDLSSASYRLEFPAPPPDPGDTAPPPAAAEVLLEGRLPDGVVLRRILRRGVPDQAAGELRLRVTAAGTCPPHALVLGLASGGASVQTLRVDPLTGTVAAYPEARSFEQLFSFVPDEREPPAP